MVNANKANYKTINDQPMSQGTRCQQLAMYVVYEMPLAMLADAPTAYEREPAILEFLAQVPTTWDETQALAGKIADYAVIARRKGREWYVGGLTDWTPRTVTVDFSFLGAGTYTAVLYTDGVNADRVGSDYKRTSQAVTKNTKLEIPMAPGGGFAIRLFPAK
jgi:alpha-glucosidase